MPDNFGGGKMIIKTLGDFRRITNGLDDAFKIDLRVRTRLSPERLAEMAYPYPFQTQYTYLEFDDIGYSDKDLCLGIEIKAS